MRWSTLFAALTGALAQALATWLVLTGRWPWALTLVVLVFGFLWVRTTYAYCAWETRREAARKHARASR